jgi:membrane protease YdiL (CAAX protease family)
MTGIGAPAGVGPMTGIGGPPPRADPVPPAEPARPVPESDRHRLVIELLVVLAIFPLPYVLSALQDLTGSLLGEGPGQRIPTIFPGHVAAGFPFVVLLVLLPLAAAAIVLYLLSLPGGDGGPKAIGLDRKHVRADLALLLPVFLLCDLIPIAGGGILLSALGVHGVNPSLGHLPGYYDLAYVAMAVVAGIVEEIVVLGYLVRRLEQLGLRPFWVVVIAVVVRGSYHLYYGWDVLPILAWATVTVLLYRRYRRLAPFIIVHVLWDAGLFLGDRFLAGEAVILTVATIVFSVMWWHYLPPRPRSGNGANQGPEPRAWSGH